MHIESEKSWSFLVASPSFEGEIFEESVVFIADDTFGVIVNKPMNLTLSQVAPQFSGSAFADIPIFDGGPVGKSQITFAAWFKKKNSQNGFSFGITPESAKKILDTESETKICAYLGYSGWGDGQLQREIDEGTWIVSGMDVKLALDTPPEKLWSKLLLKERSEFKLLPPPKNDSDENN